MRLIFLGDLVGRAGREAALAAIPVLRARYQPELLIVNAENAAHGFGITEEIYLELRDAGADVVTLGNHSFDQREALVFIERHRELLRPLNYPPGTPGRGAGLYTGATGAQILVMNVMGRVMIEPQLDDPFAATARELDLCPLKAMCDAVFIDFHAEASSEKMAFAHFVDGRVSAVVGTHTHVPTADHQVLPGGTGFLSDAGMCGDYNSVIGMEKDEPIQRFTRKVPNQRMTPANGPATVCGVMIDVDPATGLARRVQPIRMGGRLEGVMPEL